MTREEQIEQISKNILDTVKANLMDEFDGDEEAVNICLGAASVLFLTLKMTGFPIHNQYALAALIQLGHALKAGVDEIEKLHKTGN